jgi:predicted phosphodiesterase
MRIGLLCDIHEDVQSLKEALRQLERRNCDDLICLGDIVGYDVSYHKHGAKRNSSACIAAVRSNCRYAVIGNHDLFALKKIPQSTPAFPFPPNWYQLSLNERRSLSNDRVWLYETESTATRLNRSERKYLEALPEYLVLKFNNHYVYFSHSLYPDLTGSLMLRPHNPWELRGHLQILKDNGCSYGFSGHMHPNGILIGRENDIREASFGRLKLEQSLAQYSCPGIANGGGRRGYTIVDCAEMTIETFKLSGYRNKWETWYERLIKKR